MSKIYWCNNCLIPVFQQQCPLCNEFTKPTYSDLKPVFIKEKKIYETFLHMKLPHHRFLFRRFNRIILNGETLCSFKPKYYSSKSGRERWYLKFNEKKSDMQDKIDNFNNTIKKKYSTPKRYYDAILKAAEPHLKNKHDEAIKFVRQTVRDYNDRKVFVSFSGGKDSIVTAILVSEALPDKPTLFFSDTTLEHPQTYKFINDFTIKYNFDLVDYKKYASSNDFFELCRELGPPSISYRWCCTVFKSYPVNKYYNEHKEQYLTFDGIRRAESINRSKYQQITRIKKIPRQIAAYPIIDWGELEVWLYILSGALNKFDAPLLYNPLYDLGNTRVGCYVCPAASPTNCFFRKYTANNEWIKFEGIIYDYAKSVGRDKAWVDDNYWRLRRPKKDRVTAGSSKSLKGHPDPFSVSTDKGNCSDENVFLYELTEANNLGPDELEFFKPFGNMTLATSGDSTYFHVHRNNPISMKGMALGNIIRVRFNPESFAKSKRIFEKQLHKALNCVGCGGCIGVCKHGAISINEKMKKIIIDENKCTHCLECINTNFVSQGCIALNFKLEQKRIN